MLGFVTGLMTLSMVLLAYQVNNYYQHQHHRKHQ